MTSGLRSFQIEDINHLEDIAFATVVIKFDDKIGETKVGHVLQIKVRIPSNSGATIAEMQNAIAIKAKEVLKLAVERCDGKTGRQLIEDAFEKAESERNKPFEFTPIDIDIDN